MGITVLAVGDFSLTLLIVVGFFAGIALLATVFYKLFHGIAGTAARLFPRRREASPEPSSTSGLENASLPTPRIQAPEAWDRLGLSCEDGYEVRMGWYEKIFRLAEPVAGLSEIQTVEGRVCLTEGERCIVIADGVSLVVLDRRENRGAKLSIEWRQGWFETTVEGPLVKLVHHPIHGSMKVLGHYVLDAHTQESQLRIPEGWPGTSSLLPADDS